MHFYPDVPEKQDEFHIAAKRGKGHNKLSKMEITCGLTGIEPSSSAVALWTEKKVGHRGSLSPLLSLLVEMLQQGGLRAIHFLD